MVGPARLAAGAVTELVVLGEPSGQLAWAVPLVIVVAGVVCAVGLGLARGRRLRAALLAAGMVALLAAPSVWAAETLGHPDQLDVPHRRAGERLGGRSGGPGGPGAGGFAGPPSGAPRGAGRGGSARPPARGFAGAARGQGRRPPGLGGQTGGPGPGGAGGMGPDASTVDAAVSYAASHGGGTVGVSSQSSAAAAIVSGNADVAGLGGFSGRESSVTATWIAAEVRAGRLRWILTDSTQSPRLPGDTRQGSAAAFAAVQRACRAVSIPTSSTRVATTAGSAGTTRVTLYDCLGRADALARGLD